MIDEQNSLGNRLPSIRSLLAFERAASHLSFVDAAESLGRSPSAISHAVRSLEQHLGTALFERVGKSVRFTEAGKRYFDAISPLLRELELATKAAQQTQDKNIVRISALPFFTSMVLLPNLGQFETRNPGLQLQIETSNAFADVRHGEFDIALRFGKQDSKGLFCKRLLSISGLPVASKAYLNEAPNLQQPRDLLNHTLIHVRPNLGAWQDWLKINGIEAKASGDGLVFDSILGALDAAMSGHGVALLMDPLIRSHASFGNDLLAPIAGAKSNHQDYNFVCREAEWLEPGIQKTFNWLKESMANLDMG